MLFTLKKLLTSLILPPGSLLLLVMAGLLLASFTRRRRLGLFAAWTGALALFALSLPVIAGLLTRAVSDTHVLPPERLQWAQAIVVMGGGLRRDQPEYGTDVPSGLTMDRVRYGAHLARASKLPVLVTGGRVWGKGRSEADVMREVLERDFQVPVRWLEDQSRNTRENALYAARMLKRDGITRVIVVTHAVDSRRAGREFRAEGLDVAVAATQISSGTTDTWLQHLPNTQALLGSTLAIYELIGNVATSLGLSGG